MKLFLLLCTLLFSFTPLHGEEIPLHIYASQEISITAKQLRDIYIGKILEIEGKNVRVIILETPTDLHSQFLNRYIHKTPSQFMRRWKKLLYSGKASLPRQVMNLEKALDLIATSPPPYITLVYGPQKIALPQGVFTANLLP